MKINSLLYFIFLNIFMASSLVAMQRATRIIPETLVKTAQAIDNRLNQPDDLTLLQKSAALRRAENDMNASIVDLILVQAQPGVTKRQIAQAELKLQIARGNLREIQQEQASEQEIQPADQCCKIS